MSEVVIRINDLGKRYSRNPVRSYIPNPTLREALSGLIDRSRRGVGNSGSQDTTFWALREVTFDVERGQTIGIIGSNGAGKSTLLKILARIILPNEGYAQVQGQAGSLLQIGLGFHPDLTGRENVYLNGAVLGMKRATVAERFDAIVDFSEIEDFIDTPVKRYSHGMYVRLAFAVAVHMEQDILLIDEVLAAGDLQFQQKSFEKIRAITSGGKSVLIVSHAMNKIRELADRAIWIDGGRIRSMGEADSICGEYEEASLKRSPPSAP